MKKVALLRELQINFNAIIFVHLLNLFRREITGKPNLLNDHKVMLIQLFYTFLSTDFDSLKNFTSAFWYSNPSFV